MGHWTSTGLVQKVQLTGDFMFTCITSWLSDHENQIIGGFFGKLILPLAVGVLGFWASSVFTSMRDRKRQSLLGAAVCAQFVEELNNGINLMNSVLNRQNPIGQLPRKSWNGMSTISDDVLERILCLSEKRHTPGFPISEIRIHLKNYFDHICPNFDPFIEKTAQGQQLDQQTKDSLIKEYVQPAEGVLAMVQDARSRLEANAKARFPK